MSDKCWNGSIIADLRRRDATQLRFGVRQCSAAFPLRLGSGKTVVSHPLINPLGICDPSLRRAQQTLNRNNEEKFLRRTYNLRFLSLLLFIIAAPSAQLVAP